MVWLEERELLRRLRRGDPSALEELMDRDMGFACGLAGSVLRGRPRDAEEVVSDAFLALWEHAGQVEPGKLRPWLGRVVRNKALNRLRALSCLWRRTGWRWSPTGGPARRRPWSRPSGRS